MTELTGEEWDLEEVEDHEEWEEGVEVDVKGVAPLHVLPVGRHQDEVLIGDEPVKKHK